MPDLLTYQAGSCDHMCAEDSCGTVSRDIVSRGAPGTCFSPSYFDTATFSVELVSPVSQ